MLYLIGVVSFVVGFVVGKTRLNLRNNLNYSSYDWLGRGRGIEPLNPPKNRTRPLPPPKGKN